MSPVRTVLFDLDGTLADTAPDLAGALNALLAEDGREPVPFAAARAEASHGARALIRLGYGVTFDEPGFEGLRARFIRRYADNICEQTALFPGMAELLVTLETRGIAWGVVTNKPAFLTDHLMRGLGLYERAACIVSGDTTGNPKPHPEPMLYACRCTGSDPADCLYIGDAERDIQAGRNAGMKTLVALFGYFRAFDNPSAWGADGMVETPIDVLHWLNRDARVA